MKVACLQQIARDVTNYKQAHRDIVSLIDNAGREEVDLMVLPECAYPGYFLGYDLEKTHEAMDHIETVINDISNKAKEYNTYIAVGLALKDGNEIINGGVIFDRNGKIIATSGKSNLWHFDNKWFKGCTDFEVYDTDFGKVGMIICADGRAPEISRILALKGAELIIDMANLTSTGRKRDDLTNPQVDYMLPTRALENGVWLIMADKIGLEGDSVLYSGRSCVINPEGNIVALASSNKEEVIYAEIDLKASKAKLPERKPDAYNILVKPTESLPIYKKMIEPVVIWDTEIQAAVVQFKHDTKDEFIKKATRFIKSLEYQDANLIMLPQLHSSADINEVLEPIKNAISNLNTIIALTGYRWEGKKKYKSTLLFSKNTSYGKYDKIHVRENGLESGDPGEETIIKTPLCNVGIIHDEEGLIPEVSRCLMLGGADIILWSDNEIRPEIIQKTRASENKVYVLRSIYNEKDCSTITNPDGRIIASTFDGTDQSASSLILTALSKSKTVVPGTNVVLSRKPNIYEVLLNEKYIN